MEFRDASCCNGLCGAVVVLLRSVAAAFRRVPGRGRTLFAAVLAFVAVGGAVVAAGGGAGKEVERK